MDNLKGQWLHEKFIFNYVSAWGRKLTIENSTYHYIKGIEDYRAELWHAGIVANSLRYVFITWSQPNWTLKCSCSNSLWYLFTTWTELLQYFQARQSYQVNHLSLSSFQLVCNQCNNFAAKIINSFFQRGISSQDSGNALVSFTCTSHDGTSTVASATQMQDSGWPVLNQIWACLYVKARKISSS